MQNRSVVRTRSPYFCCSSACFPMWSCQTEAKELQFNSTATPAQAHSLHKIKNCKNFGHNPKWRHPVNQTLQDFTMLWFATSTQIQPIPAKSGQCCNFNQSPQLWPIFRVVFALLPGLRSRRACRTCRKKILLNNVKRGTLACKAEGSYFAGRAILFSNISENC